MGQTVQSAPARTGAEAGGKQAGAAANSPAWKKAADEAHGEPAPVSGDAPGKAADQAGHLQFQGAAGAGRDNVVQMPDAKAVPGVATAPFDPSGELNRLKGDGDTATFSISAGARLSVPTPWKVALGGQAQAGYGVTVKQVGGGGPGEPATTTPPVYQVTFDKNQLAGLNAQIGAGSAAPAMKGDLFGKISGEVNLTHADRVTMTFASKDDAARSIRLLQGETEAQSLRDMGTALDSKLTLPNPVPGVEAWAHDFQQHPMQAIGHALNPVNGFHAAEDAAKTVWGGIEHQVGSLFGNPLKGDNGGAAPPGNTIAVPLSPAGALVGAALDSMAERVQPNAQDLGFLRSHVSGYEEQVGAQERGSLELKFGSCGIDPRLTATESLTRTVVLPAGGKAGTVSYEAKGALDLSTKDKAKVDNVLDKSGLLGAAGKLPGLKDALGVNTTTTLGQASVAAKLTFAMTPAQSAAMIASNGAETPGIDQMGAPQTLDVTLAGKLGVPQGTGAQNANFVLKGSIPNPGATLGEAKDKLFHDGVGGAVDLLARNGTLTGEVNHSTQVGGNIGIEPGLTLEKGPAAGAEAKLIFTGTRQTETIDARATGRIAWTPDAPPAGAPPAGAPPAGAPPAGAPPARPPAAGQPPATPAPLPAPTSAPAPQQVVVLPHAGLNIRAEPGDHARVLGPATSGTFLQATGQTRTDASGERWIEVKGPDINRRQQTGWVSERFTAPHAQGAEDVSGRVNELRRQGYVPITVHPGDTISGIAMAHGVDPAKAVATNAGHVIDTNLIFPGDTVYVPKR